MLVKAFLTRLLTAASGGFTALDPFELTRLEVVATVFELAEHPLPRHAILQLANGLFHPIVPNHDLQRSAYYGFTDAPAPALAIRVPLVPVVLGRHVHRIIILELLFLVSVEKHADYILLLRSFRERLKNVSSPRCA
jgi:hypothetical protein